MLKRPHFIALGVVGLLALMILNLPQHTADRIKLAFGGLFLPLFGLSRSTQQAVKEAGDAVTTRAELLREIEAFRRTNAVLQLSAAQNDVLLRENNELRQLRDWQQQSPWKNRLHLGRVLARDPANWWQVLYLDLGSRDGIQVDLPVLTPEGYLVGRIASVSLTRSEVLLISNPNCPVSAQIEKANETGKNDTGIIKGATGPFSSLVSLGLLPAASNAKPGDLVSTSGLGVFPRGIRIGQIAEDPQTTELGSGEVRVKLFANLSGLEEVWVLTP